MLGEFPSLNEPMRNSHTRDTEKRFISDCQQIGFRILGENGIKLAHLRLVSCNLVKITEIFRHQENAHFCPRSRRLYVFLQDVTRVLCPPLVT